MGVANQLDGSCNPAGNWKGNHLVGMMVGRCTTMGKLRQEFHRLTSLNGVRMQKIHKSWGFKQQHQGFSNKTWFFRLALPEGKSCPRMLPSESVTSTRQASSPPWLGKAQIGLLGKSTIETGGKPPFLSPNNKGFLGFSCINSGKSRQERIVHTSLKQFTLLAISLQILKETRHIFGDPNLFRREHHKTVVKRWPRLLLKDFFPHVLLIKTSQDMRKHHVGQQRMILALCLKLQSQEW